MRPLIMLLLLTLSVSITHAQDTAAVEFMKSDTSGYNFGTIPLGEKSQLDVPVKNIGSVPLRIKSITSDAADIKFKASKTVIKAGKKCFIYAMYEPVNQVTGTFTNKVTVSFVGVDIPSTFEIRGAVVPNNSDVPMPQRPTRKPTNNSPKAVGRRVNE